MKANRLPILLLLFVATLVMAAGFDYGLKPLAVAKDVYVFPGRNEDFNFNNGGNIVNTGFIVTADGVVVIDSGPSLRYGQQMRAAIATVSDKPILRVFNTHAHPDHFLGNQAFPANTLYALPGARQQMLKEGNAFAENMYRLNGDWMKDTEAKAPEQDAQAGRLNLGGHTLELIALEGHTSSDLAVYDHSSGVLFAGDLVFNGRAPTTPHAHIERWLAALDRLEAITQEPGFTRLVPGHGPVSTDAAPIRQTRRYLQWLVRTVNEGAEHGEDMNEVMAHAKPEEFKDMAVITSEYRRSVGHLFPAAEQAALKAR
ncbi:MAG: quinoprotein relay system zinc metallohydrolase 1 [Rhodocyclaceae bacterium]|nr:MAG: quinoprotein relay system zinc metallohydrolase 1 [Rhodocyclaceae bacterium]